MKIKPMYVYLILFFAFIIGIILFTNKSSSVDMTQKIPDDDVHRNMGKEGEMPSGSNVNEDARKRLDELKLSYEKNPGDTLRIREYADMLKFAHQPEKAIELYETILKKDSKRIDILLELTSLYFNNGDFDKADAFTNDILKIENNNQIAVYNSGAIAAARGDKSKAKTIWQGLINKYPNTDIASIAKQSIMQIDKPNQ